MRALQAALAARTAVSRCEHCMCLRRFWASTGAMRFLRNAHNERKTLTRSWQTDSVTSSWLLTLPEPFAPTGRPQSGRPLARSRARACAAGPGPADYRRRSTGPPGRSRSADRGRPVPSGRCLRSCRRPFGLRPTLRDSLRLTPSGILTAGWAGSSFGLSARAGGTLRVPLGLLF